MLNGPAYDPQEGDWGRVGEQKSSEWLRLCGFVVTKLPHGKYGPDIDAESEIEKFYFEPERRHGWQKGPWPQYAMPEINVPIRRPVTLNRLFLTMRSDMAVGLLIFGVDLVHARIDVCDNRRMRGEQMRKIPYERCLPVDLNESYDRSFAELNAERIRKAMADISDREQRKKYLGSECPYGLDLTEWTHFLNECNGELHRAILAAHPPLSGPQEKTLFG